MNTAGLALSLALGAGLWACSHQGARSPSTTSAQAPPSPNSGCPVAQLPGVHALVVDLDGGSAVTFTAPQSELDQLRQGVRAMADANDKQGSAFAICPCAFGTIGSAESMPGGSWSSDVGATSAQPAVAVPADAGVDDIANGAVLKLTAKDASQVQALREQARAAVDSMKTNGCIGQGG